MGRKRSGEESTTKEKHTGRCGEKEKDEKLIGIKSGGLHFFSTKKRGLSRLRLKIGKNGSIVKGVRR